MAKVKEKHWGRNKKKHNILKDNLEKKRKNKRNNILNILLSNKEKNIETTNISGWNLDENNMLIKM